MEEIDGTVQDTTFISHLLASREYRCFITIVTQVLLIIGMLEPFILLKPPLNTIKFDTINTQFMWHVSLGMVAAGLYTESLWVLNFKVLSRTFKIRLHIILVIASAVMMGVCCYQNNRFSGAVGGPITWHGYIGLTSSGYCLIHSLIGVLIFSKRTRTNFMLDCYTWSLVVVLTGMGATLYLTMFSHWFQGAFQGVAWDICLFTLVIWYIYTGYPLINSKSELFI